MDRTGGIGMRRKRDKKRSSIWRKAVGAGMAVLLCGAALSGCGNAGSGPETSGGQQAADDGVETMQGEQTTGTGGETMQGEHMAEGVTIQEDQTTGTDGEMMQGDQTAGTDGNGQQGQPEWNGTPRMLQANRTVEYARAGALDETLMESTNAFAYQFGDKLASEGENYFFSPYSICSALAVLDNAAGGETKEQIEQMLGIADLEHYNEQLSFYMQEPQHEEARLQSANSIWIDRHCTLADQAYTDYLPLVEFYYGAEIWEADFAYEPDQTKDAINQWVEEHTGGMIPHYKEEVDRDTVLSIINAVYFYGEWSAPFAAEATFEQTFHGENGDSDIMMMHQGELHLPYYEQDGLCGISLPYGDGSVVMNILLPAGDASQSAAELFGLLSDAEKNHFLTTLMDSETRFVESLAIPKFTMDYSVRNMRQLLEELGMKAAFAPGEADFAGIADPDTSAFYVSDASHMAKLEVDELGSRAAAVTEFGIKNMALVMEDDPVSFIADRPFVFFIQDKDAGMILFMGEVRNL